PKISPIVAGTPAASAEPPFEPGDVIKRIGETEVSTFLELETALSQKRAEAVAFYVERESVPRELVKISVPANHFRTLAAWMDFGQITALQTGAPAAADDGLKVGDKILSVNGNEVGTTIDPLALPDYVASLAGQDVEVKVKRPVEGAGSQE